MNFLTRNKNLVLAAGAIVAVFAVWNFLDLGNSAYSGYFTNPTNEVIRVRDGSPAQAAGLQIGDRIETTGGIAINDSKALARRARAEIGDVRELVVLRDGEQVTLSLTFAEQPSQLWMTSMVSWLTGVFFLIFGLLPYLKRQSEHSGLLATACLCFALLFIGIPYFSSFALRTLASALTLPVVIFGMAAMLHFVLAFPKESGWLSKSNSKRILYGPPALMSLLFLYLILVQPDSGDTFQMVLNVVLGVFFLAYLGGSLFVMVRTYLQASAEDRTAHGLTMLMLGAVLALVPVVVSIVVGVIAPSVVLPGSDFYGLSFILLPLALWFAVSRSAATAAA